MSQVTAAMSPTPSLLVELDDGSDVVFEAAALRLAADVL